LAANRHALVSAPSQVDVNPSRRVRWWPWTIGYDRSTELAQETPEARSFEEQAAKREEAARDKLAEIRRSLRGDPPS